VNYIGLIPFLIAAHKEQAQRMEEQQAEVASLQSQFAEVNGRLIQVEELLAACCASPTDSDQRSGYSADDQKLTPAQERLLRIAPNPFTDRTTLFCTLERAGRMQLLANSADGRSLLVLSEGQREAGEFQYEWSTENLAPGVYYITLLLDGEPVVKRAVKVGG
jgi:hypothetical protein